MGDRSCRTCKYDTEMYEQNFCTLRKDIVMEFAKEHLGFPEDFKILDNWFMGLEPCEFYEKAHGEERKHPLETAKNQIKNLIEEVDEISVDPTAYQVLILTLNFKEKLEQTLQILEVDV